MIGRNTRIKLTKYNNISNYEINYDNYDFCGKEGSHSVYKRNIFKTFPLVKSGNCELFSTTDIEQRERLDYFKSFYLLHKIQYMEPNEDHLNYSIEHFHISVARIMGFSTHDPDEEGNPGTFLMIERPANGPLLSFFNFISQCESNSQPKLTNQFSDPYSIEPLQLTDEDKFIIILGICAGIRFIHQSSVHSSLNPMSVYIDEEIHAVICNYEIIEGEELAIEVNEDNDENSAFYNQYAYVAPETLKDKKVSQESDIFSFGMLVYYVLTGEDPFKGCDQQTIKRKIIEGEIPDNDSIKKEWKELIKMCCQLNPKERPSAEKLLSGFLDDKRMQYYFKSTPNRCARFTMAQDEYINKLKCCEFRSEEGLGIFKFIDPSEISPRDLDIFAKANRTEPPDLNLVLEAGDILLEGRGNNIKDEEIAIQIFKIGYKNKHPKCTKQLADLCKKKNKLKSALKYYQKARSFYKDDHYEISLLDSKIAEIKDDIEHEEEDDDDYDPIIENEDTSIFIKKLPNTTTEPDIIKLFSGYHVKQVTFRIYGIFHTALVNFDTVEERNKVFEKYSNDSGSFKIGNSQIEIDSDLISNHIIDSRYLVHNSKFQIDLNNYYPGPSRKKYKKIGDGASSTVYMAYQRKTKKVFAAKVFKELQSMDDPLVTRKNFRREINTLVNLKNKLFIKLHGYAMRSLVDPNIRTPTIIMDFLPNKSLDDAIKNHPEWFDDTVKMKALIGISKGMSCLHRRKIIHRDLKPENIFFDKNYEIKIGDLGCSRPCQPDNPAVTPSIGTPLYLPPELINQKGNYSFEVDIYPFGFIFLEILTGEKTKPSNNSIYNYQRQVLRGMRPSIPDNIDENLKQLIQLLWSGNINDRPLYSEVYAFLKAVYKSPSPPPFLPKVNVELVNEYIDKLERIK